MSMETQDLLTGDHRLKGGLSERENGSKGEQKSTVERLIQLAYSRLKELDAVSALGYLQEALKIDFEHPEVKYGLKCINWWLERVERLDDFHEVTEKGGYIISQWRSFHTFLGQIDQIGEAYDSCQDTLRCYVFSLSLNFFINALSNAGKSPEPELLIQVGRCYKGLGNYEEASKYLEYAIRFKPEDSGALAELADINALLGDLRAAKVLFREAFFLDPQAIDLWSMESDMIIRLRKKVEELGYEGRDLSEWIPVYGALWGIFSVRRELKPIEISKLKQSILALESEAGRTEVRANFRLETARTQAGIHEASSLGNFFKPRLLNRYFWLIDHYGTLHNGNVRNNSVVVEETMRKIKLVDPAIYEQYRN